MINYFHYVAHLEDRQDIEGQHEELPVLPLPRRSRRAPWRTKRHLRWAAVFGALLPAVAILIYAGVDAVQHPAGPAAPARPGAPSHRVPPSPSPQQPPGPIRGPFITDPGTVPVYHLRY